MYRWLTEAGRKGQGTLRGFSEPALHGMRQQISAVTNQIQNFHPAVVVGEGARKYLPLLKYCVPSEETRWYLLECDEKTLN